MVCDFFFPQLGGVEFHIYHLSQKLIQLGHSVIVITHAYGDRIGIRYLTNGLKIYYVPYLVFYRETTFPTLFATFPIFRNIFIREQINIIHSHGSVSTFALEAIFHGNTMGLVTVFTDHSLYGFDSIGTILANKLLKFSLTNIGSIICVSNTCKENMILRAEVDPEEISVIPNAVVEKDFRPLSESEKKKKNKNRITVIVISRLFPNKGAELLTHVIPKICKSHLTVDFIIAGDGPKFVDFQQMIETYRLQGRVKLLGFIKHENVRNIMCLGDIYLHASLTEAFGTVLVEAASCGLLIVSTTVGGIPEVFPRHMAVYANETSVSSLVEAINVAISKLKNNDIDTNSFHDSISQMYDWLDVAKRTTKVYDNIINSLPNTKNHWLYMLKRLYARDGSWARLLYVLCGLVEYILFIILESLYPVNNIDIAPKWPKRYPK